MKKAVRVCRVILGAVCVLIACGGLIAAVSEHMPGMYALVAVFAALAAFLFHRKKDTAVVTFAPQEVPQDILKDMRRCYTIMQARDDARIMSESFALAQKTTDIGVFEMRLTLAAQKALTLLQAEKAGCKGVKRMRVTRACNAVLASTGSAKVDFLERSYQKETAGALQLKTDAGRRKRLEAYLSKLEEHRDVFAAVEDTYNATVQQVQSLMV